MCSRGRASLAANYDFLYSASLFLALVASGIGSFFFDYFLVMRVLRRPVNKRLSRFAYYCGSIAVVSGIFSVTIHLVFGHGTTAGEPMEIGEFLIHHKAYWVVAVLTLLAFLGPAIADPER